MANYSLVIDSKFKPFSYAELLAPVAASTEAHQKVEENYEALMDKASVWEGMANETTDAKTYAQYKKYANDLKNSADVLAREGLTPTSRSNLNDMRRRYSAEIIPIENAYKARAEQIKAQQDALIKDPTHMFAKSAANTSLDEYLNNPSYDTLSNNYSGALLTQQASQAAAHLAKTLRDYGKGKPVDAYTNTFLQKYGYSGTDVNNVVSALTDTSNPAHKTILGQIADNVMASSGISNWNDKALTDKAWGYIGQGLYSAVGEDKVSPMENKGAIMAAENAYAMQRQRASWAHQAAVAKRQAAQQQMQIIGAEMDPIKLYGVVSDKDLKGFKDAGYIKNVNGKTIATNKSRQDYKAFLAAAKQGGITVKQAIDLATMSRNDAQEWIQKHRKGNQARLLQKAFSYSTGTTGTLRLAGQYAGALNTLAKGSKSPLIKYGKGDNQYYGFQPGNIGNLFASNGGGGSATTINETTAWRYHIDSTNQGSAMETLKSDLGKNSTFNIVNRDGSSAGTTFDKKKLDNKNYKVTHFIMSPKGMVAEIHGAGDNEGEVFYIDVPQSESKKAIMKTFTNNEAYKKLYHQDPRSKDFANFAYTSGLSDAYTLAAHMVRTNIAAPQKLESYGTPIGYNNPWQQPITDESEEE